MHIKHLVIFQALLFDLKDIINFLAKQKYNLGMAAETKYLKFREEIKLSCSSSLIYLLREVS